MRPLFPQMTQKILAAGAAAGIFLMAIFFLMYGAAVGLGTVFVQPWIGWVIVGGVVLVSALIFFAIPCQKRPKAPRGLLQQILARVDGPALRAWTQRHPYHATGAAAAAGFVATGTDVAELTELLKTALVPLLVEYFQAQSKSA